MERAAGAEVVGKSGCAPSFNHGPRILWWMHERKRTFRTIRSFVQPGGYAAMRLCGLDSRDAFIDTSYLHFSGFADNRKNRWDAALCKRFRLDPGKLPRIVDPHAVIGEVTGTMARRCGLRAGVPVVAGCGDTAASFLACGAVREGICVDVAGTASVFACTTKAFRADKRHRTLGCGRAATPGLWHPYAYINGGGMNLEWFRNQIVTLGKKATVDFDTLNGLAAGIAPSDTNPIFVPHLGGRVSPSWPSLRGAWAGIDWSHSAAHLYRAVLEGVALEYGIYRDVVRQLNPGMSLREIRVTGGGEKSTVWNQIKADALQTRVVQVTRPEGAPLGAALLAGYGVGLFKSLPAAAGKWIGLGKAFKPDRKLAAHYRVRLKTYRHVLEALNTWSEQQNEGGR
jgi:xylulokinase